MKEVLIISTGGTFNKIYSPLNGKLEIDTDSTALDDIARRWLCEFEIVNIIGKDSLDITNTDRLLLLATINLSKHDDIIIIHGTDTMELSAAYLADSNLIKRVILTGAMVPYFVNPVEATANLASAFGYLQGCTKNGVYIAMNGIMDEYHSVIKDREAGRFVSST
ncbi:MAG: asparaginase domain-containing protein [Campylobacterota bacterium]|nr:asparaginase domain-containing protein [Campylobacterota bacterium]